MQQQQQQRQWLEIKCRWIEASGWMRLTWLHLVGAVLWQIPHERVGVLLHDALELFPTARALPTEIVGEEDVLRVCVDILREYF